MLKFRNRKLSQAGDTIIEVLICMAVVSLALGGAFVTTHNSQLGVRDSQEHSEALQLMQSQVEQLRSDTSDSSIFGTGNFCMFNGAKASGTNCKQNSSGQPGKTDSRYAMLISCGGSTCPDGATGGYDFTVTATWDEVNGGGTATEQMIYRLYQ